MKKRPILAALLVLTLMFTLIPAAAPAQAKIKAKILITGNGTEKDATIIYVKKNYKLRLSKKPGALDRWETSDTQIATIDQKGVLKTKACGKVKVTAYDGGGNVLAKKTFTVEQRAKKITVSLRKLTLKINQKQTVNFTVTPKDSTDVIVVTVTDKKIASAKVGDGQIVIKGLKKGTTTITIIAKAKKRTSNKDKSNVIAKITVNVVKKVPAGGIPEEPEKPTEPTSVKVTFDANGGQFPPGAETEREIEIDTEIGKLPEGLERDSYDFRGWALFNDAEEEDVFEATTFAEDTTIYAVWEARQPIGLPTGIEGGNKPDSGDPGLYVDYLETSVIIDTNHLLLVNTGSQTQLYAGIEGEGRGTVTYQWYKNGTALTTADARTDTLTVLFDASKLHHEYFVEATYTQPGCKPTKVRSEVITVSCVNTLIPLVALYHGTETQRVATGAAISTSYTTDDRLMLANVNDYNDSQGRWSTWLDMETCFEYAPVGSWRWDPMQSISETSMVYWNGVGSDIGVVQVACFGSLTTFAEIFGGLEWSDAAATYINNTGSCYLIEMGLVPQ